MRMGKKDVCLWAPPEPHTLTPKSSDLTHAPDVSDLIRPGELSVKLSGLAALVSPAALMIRD